MSHAKLDKLSVMGIRSFDFQTSSVIQFTSPLTLIVGHNGSGKTTIIECLKYLTTGDLPPNSKGGAFIHDPKLAGEKEVLAVCRLSYLNTQEKKMVCSRRLQLTVKKNQRSMKSLEGALTLSANGERTAISSRVAELDQMVPMYLGVSKSILDNVIFCHQDESLWPMSEPSVLKKKFDEIFEAMKYTKAIDNIKVLRKKYQDQLSELKTVENYAKEEKSKGEKSEKQQSQLDSEIQTLRDKSRTLQNQITEAEEKYGHAQDTAAGFNEIISALNGKRIEAKAKEDSLKDLEENTKVMDNSDEELQSMLEKYQDRVAHFQEDRQSKLQNYHDLETQIADTRRKTEQKGQEKGKLHAAKEQYDSQICRREELIKRSAHEHGIRGFDQELEEDHIKDFIDRIAKMAKDQRSVLERAQKQSREDTKKVQDALNTLNNRKSTLLSNLHTTRKAVGDEDNKAQRLRAEANAINVDEGRQAVLQSNVNEVQAKLSAANETWEKGGWDHRIGELQDKLQSYDRTSDQLQSDLVQASKHNDEASRAALLKQDLNKTKLELQSLEGAHKDDIARAVGSSWSLPDVWKQFLDAQSSKASGLRKAEKQRDGMDQELQQIKYKLKAARGELKEKKAEHDKLQKKVQDVCQEGEDPSQFEEILANVEQDYEQLASDSNNFVELQKYYQGCQRVLDDKNMCTLCSRSFKAESEKTAIRKKIQENLRKAEQNLKEQNKADFESALKEMKQVKPAYDRWVHLRDVEIPQAQKDVDQLEPKQEELSRKIEREDVEVQKHQSSKSELDSWADTVRKISDHVSNIARLEGDLQSFTQKQSQSSSMKSTDELHAQIKEANEQRRTTDATLSRLRAEREQAQTNMTRLELALRDERSSLSHVTQQLEKKASLKNQAEEVKRQVEALRSTLTEADQELSGLNPEIEQTQLKLDDTSNRGEKRIAEIQDGMNDLSNTLSKLENASHDIRSYEDANIPSQLQSCERAINSLHSDLARLEKELKTVTSEINKLKEEETKHGQTQHQIHQNIRYRNNRRSLDATYSEIEELESHNAEADRQHWAQEASKWQHRRNKLNADNAGIIGELKSKDQELERLIKDWETLYDGAAYRYREAHVKVEATKAAVIDLQRYSGALDSAIMRYHSLKMNEINEIVDDLWRRTYQGTDVDTVLIRSDTESSTARAGNKSYNYRVCMMKQDAEMDMRGRCSAGQKVLASIIIRLALAECFGANCGVMALDEPTTNLDRDNIRALAASLNQIIKSRASMQQNFQLIVITHDEDFLKDMRAIDFVDEYWRVSRNERQKSMIEKQKLSVVWN
ncbi:MAG: hypothetical protein Q9162_002938 [Coniocarpon cinnabarinum]